MSDDVEELKARLAEVTAERDEFRDLFTANYTLAKEAESYLDELLGAVEAIPVDGGAPVMRLIQKVQAAKRLAAKIREERS